MTLYLAAYDVDMEACTEALSRIVPIHEEYGMPATFFIRAQLLDVREQECRRLVGDNPLFEVAVPRDRFAAILARIQRLAPGPT